MTDFLRTGRISLTALALLLAVPALAQTPATDPHHPAGTPAANAPSMGMMMPMGQMMGGSGMMPMGGGGMMGAMMQHPAGYAAFLKAELAITEAQNSVWTAYMDQLQAGIKRHQGKMPMAGDGSAAPTSWIERITDSEARLTMHLDMIKKIKPSATALYAALSAEQKKKADLLMPGGMMGMGGMDGKHKRGMH